MHQLFAQRDIDLQFGSQISGGKSLIRHKNYTNEPDQKWICWETSIRRNGTFVPDPNMYDGIPEWRFGRYDQAFKNHTWDKVVFQIYASGLHDDIEAISAFIDLALANKTASGFYVYCAWPRRMRIVGPDGQTTDEVGNIDYPAVWKTKYTATPDDTSKTANWNTPSRDYAAKLLDHLNRKYKTLETPIRLIPTGEVLFALDEKIKKDELPGLKELAERKPEMLPGLDGDTGFSHGVNVLYADSAHLNPIPHQGDTLGIFVAGTTMFAALSGQSPVGLSGANYGLDDAQDHELILDIQQTIQDVLSAESSR